MCNQTSSDPACPHAMLITLCRVSSYKGPELIRVMEGATPDWSGDIKTTPKWTQREAGRLKVMQDWRLW